MSNLKQIISKGQGVNLEFISNSEFKEEIARTIVAFANTEGGSILLGVKDNGKIIGSNPNDDLSNVEEIIQEYCAPQISFESITHRENRHLVLEILIPKSEVKHKTKDEKGEFKFYYRLEDQTLLVNKVVVQLWKLQDNKISTPETPDEKVDELKELIQSNQPVTMSKLFRLTSMDKNDVIKLLALMMYWDIIARIKLDSGVGYIIHKKV